MTLSVFSVALSCGSHEVLKGIFFEIDDSSVSIGPVTCSAYLLQNVHTLE